jgi:hypothetical protein
MRIEKTKDYTVMANHHLRNHMLSLKAKGLLSLMLSLPDNWDYTVRGLAAICREGVDSIGAALRELAQAGYLIRRQLRNEKGKIIDTEYVIYEKPYCPDDPDTENPYMGNPDAETPAQLNTKELDAEYMIYEKPYCPDDPDTENPYMGNPDTETPTQLNTKELNTKELNTPSIYPPIHPPDQKLNMKETMDRTDQYRQAILENIEYDSFPDTQKAEIAQLTEIMVDAVSTTKSTLWVGGEPRPAEVVRSVLLKLDSTHIEYVLQALKTNTTAVKNVKAYLLAVLYNAAMTIDHYWRLQVNHDLYQKRRGR